MCSSLKLMKEAKPVTQRRDSVSVADGRSLPLTHIGKVEIPLSNGGVLTLNQVLCVPKFAKNLLSVRQIVEDGHSVEMSKDGCILKDLAGEPVKATRRGNLWVLKHTHQPGEKVQEGAPRRRKALNSVQEHEGLRLWHLRYGHLGENALRLLQRKELVSGMGGQLFGEVKGSCAGCVAGRQHRIPFYPSGRQSGRVLELVHSDPFGPHIRATL